MMEGIVNAEWRDIEKRAHAKGLRVVLMVSERSMCCDLFDEESCSNLRIALGVVDGVSSGSFHEFCRLVDAVLNSRLEVTL